MNFPIKLIVGSVALLFGTQIGLATAGSAPATVFPKGTVQLSPCIPTMGEHWAIPKDFPFGPIYGVYQGKVVFTEVMIDQRAFAAGKSFDSVLKPPPGYAIDHVDIDFQPHGHAHYPIPHYDIHAYFVPHSEHITYCPPKPTAKAQLK